MHRKKKLATAKHTVTVSRGCVVRPVPPSCNSDHIALPENSGCAGLHHPASGARPCPAQEIGSMAKPYSGSTRTASEIHDMPVNSGSAGAHHLTSDACSDVTLVTAAHSPLVPEISDLPMNSGSADVHHLPSDAISILVESINDAEIPLASEMQATPLNSHIPGVHRLGSSTANSINTATPRNSASSGLQPQSATRTVSENGIYTF